MTFSELLKLFLADRSQNVKPTTVEFYSSRLASFLKAFRDRELSTITSAEIHAHLAAVGEKLTKSTRRHNIVAWEQIQKFAVERDFLEKPITKPMSKPTMGTRDRIPTEEETVSLLAHAAQPFRDIYEMLRASGARPGELCRAQISDLRRTSAGAVIELREHKTAGKTGRPRKIPFGKKHLKTIDRCIAGRTKGPIFLNTRGQAWTVEALSRTYRQLRDNMKLPRDLVLYLARHEAGTRMCKEAGIAIAQKMLGHCSPNMTAKYVHTDVDDVSAMMDKIGDDADESKSADSNAGEAI